MCWTDIENSRKSRAQPTPATPVAAGALAKLLSARPDRIGIRAALAANVAGYDNFPLLIGSNDGAAFAPYGAVNLNEPMANLFITDIGADITYDVYAKNTSAQAVTVIVTEVIVDGELPEIQK
jgi:hypothetical protein